jgi:hypothetical protein
MQASQEQRSSSQAGPDGVCSWRAIILPQPSLAQPFQAWKLCRG